MLYHTDDDDDECGHKKVSHARLNDADEITNETQTIEDILILFVVVIAFKRAVV